ncbi:hypothetical protein M0804_011002 [Polistes exclamans]|nr:hypothetical protein M0804_011002 [Polistes exclamans]
MKFRDRSFTHKSLYLSSNDLDSTGLPKKQQQQQQLARGLEKPQREPKENPTTSQTRARDRCSILNLNFERRQKGGVYHIDGGTLDKQYVPVHGKTFKRIRAAALLSVHSSVLHS